MYVFMYVCMYICMHVCIWVSVKETRSAQGAPDGLQRRQQALGLVLCWFVLHRVSCVVYLRVLHVLRVGGFYYSVEPSCVCAVLRCLLFLGCTVLRLPFPTLSGPGQPRPSYTMDPWRPVELVSQVMHG